MSKELEKSGDSHRISLDDPRYMSGEIKITIDWSRGGKLKSLFGGAVDLDLGCFYELRDGTRRLIDGLQFAHGNGGARDEVTAQGCYTDKPYIWHTGDDQGRRKGSGEAILVNPAGLSEIKRIMVYTFIYDGVAHWAESNAVARISVPGSEDVIVKMGDEAADRRFCVIASLDVDDDNTIEVTKHVTFHDSHADCDEEYGWGFSYAPGEK